MKRLLPRYLLVRYYCQNHSNAADIFIYLDRDTRFLNNPSLFALPQNDGTLEIRQEDNIPQQTDGLLLATWNGNLTADGAPYLPRTEETPIITVRIILRT